MVFHMELAEEVSFLNKGSFIHQFRKIPPKSTVIIDSSGSKYIDNDVREVINNFSESAKTKDITVEMRGIQLQR